METKNDEVQVGNPNYAARRAMIKKLKKSMEKGTVQGTYLTNMLNDLDHPHWEAFDIVITYRRLMDEDYQKYLKEKYGR